MVRSFIRFNQSEENENIESDNTNFLKRLNINNKTISMTAKTMNNLEHASERAVVGFAKYPMVSPLASCEALSALEL